MKSFNIFGTEEKSERKFIIIVIEQCSIKWILILMAVGQMEWITAWAMFKGTFLLIDLWRKKGKNLHCTLYLCVFTLQTIFSLAGKIAKIRKNPNCIIYFMWKFNYITCYFFRLSLIYGILHSLCFLGWFSASNTWFILFSYGIRKWKSYRIKKP